MIQRGYEKEVLKLPSVHQIPKLSHRILLQEFTDVKRKYTILQEKLKTQGPPKVTLEKVKQLKEEAEKLAEETEKKIKRITGDVFTSTVSGKHCDSHEFKAEVLAHRH